MSEPTHYHPATENACFCTGACLRPGGKCPVVGFRKVWPPREPHKVDTELEILAIKHRINVLEDQMQQIFDILLEQQR